jgi:hypothetical protein
LKREQNKSIDGPGGYHSDFVKDIRHFDKNNIYKQVSNKRQNIVSKDVLKSPDIGNYSFDTGTFKQSQ